MTTSVVVRWAVVGAAVAALGALPVSLASVAAADPQCADPAMCQSAPANPEDCNGGPDDMVCTRAGDAELHSSPNPADIPEVPQAEQPPWMVFGNPGMGR